jgi:hypothetical protein
MAKEKGLIIRSNLSYSTTRCCAWRQCLICWNVVFPAVSHSPSAFFRCVRTSDELSPTADHSILSLLSSYPILHVFVLFSSILTTNDVLQRRLVVQ